MEGVLGGGAGAGRWVEGVRGTPMPLGLLSSLGASWNAVSTDPVSRAASHGLFTSFRRGCENFSWNFSCGLEPGGELKSSSVRG